MRFFPDPPTLVALGGVLALALALLAAFGERRRRARLARFADPELLDALVPASARRAARGRASRLAVAGLLAGLAFAGPRWGEGSDTVQQRGVDLALALDASLSMLAPDEPPSRLVRVQQEVRRLRASGPGDRYALIAFAGRSYILSPLTTDAGALDLFLDNLDPSLVGQPGSALGPAMRQGRELLMASRGGAERALVVFSDGEAFDAPDAALTEAAALKQAGILVVVVGFGTAEGARIPEDGGVHRDADGQPVVTRYDAERLTELAAAAGGVFIPATASDKASRIRQALARLRAERRTVQESSGRPLRYQWLLFPAVLLLLWDAVAATGGRRRRRRAASAAAVPAAVLLAAMLGALTPGPLGSQDDPAVRRPDRNASENVRRFRQRIAEGDRRPETWYDLGTALLAADSLGAAVDALERAVRTAPGPLRARAQYNLGLAHLERSRGAAKGSDSAKAAAREAVAAYKQVLLASPLDADARWNYELALREQDEKGGGSPEPQTGGQARPDPAEQGRPLGSLSSAQAQQLLDNAARDERTTQRRRQDRDRTRRSAAEKDW